MDYSISVFHSDSGNCHGNGWFHFCSYTVIVILHFQSHRVLVSTTYIKTVFHLHTYIFVLNCAVSLLNNLETARQGMSMLLSDEQRLMFEGRKKGFA